jgi:putative NADPH-quinone reductase
MRVMITMDHPYEKSFNYALLHAAEKGARSAGAEVDILVLNNEDFNPVMSREELAVYTQGQYLDPKVGDYQQRILQADHLIYIFPVWWEVMPALMKGFFDKVFLPEWAFAEADASPKLAHINTGTAITTMGAPKPIWTSVEAVLCKGILEFCGVQRTQWINYCTPSLVSAEMRAQWLSDIEQYVRDLIS